MTNHLEIRMSDKLRRTILAKTRPSDDYKQVGELVSFKRTNDDRWRGPGIVADSIRGQVSVKMGRQFYAGRHQVLVRATKEEVDEYDRANPGQIVTIKGQFDDQDQLSNSGNEDQNTWLETEYDNGSHQNTHMRIPVEAPSDVGMPVAAHPDVSIPVAVPTVVGIPVAL